MVKASRSRRAFELVASALLVAAVAWSFLAFPWVEDPENWTWCLRTGPSDLRGLTIAWDAAIFAAYAWIPFDLFLTWLGLEVKPGQRLLVLYGTFIVLCGFTHGMDGLNLWLSRPYYWAAMKLKAVTGAVSLAVAYVTETRRPDMLRLGRQGRELREKTAAAEKAEHDACVARERAEEEAESARTASLALADRARELAEANARLRDQAAELAGANARLEGQAREAEEREQALQAAIDRVRSQERAIAELSTPVIELDDGVLLLPIVGTFDSGRALQIVEQSAAIVTSRGAEVVIVDVTGVPVMDTGVVDSFVKLARVLALLGARCVLTGIRGAVAQTMVEQGVAIEGFVTRATLKAGIREARTIAAARR